jgi:hypothetical protein
MKRVIVHCYSELEVNPSRILWEEIMYFDREYKKLPHVITRVATKEEFLSFIGNHYNPEQRVGDYFYEVEILD